MGTMIGEMIAAGEELHEHDARDEAADVRPERHAAALGAIELRPPTICSNIQ